MLKESISHKEMPPSDKAKKDDTKKFPWKSCTYRQGIFLNKVKLFYLFFFNPPFYFSRLWRWIFCRKLWIVLAIVSLFILFQTLGVKQIKKSYHINKKHCFDFSFFIVLINFQVIFIAFFLWVLKASVFVFRLFLSHANQDVDCYN